MTGYEYKCMSCGSNFLQDFPMGKAPKKYPCKLDCDGTAERILSTINIQPSNAGKGGRSDSSGYKVTDYIEEGNLWCLVLEREEPRRTAHRRRLKNYAASTGDN